MKVLAVIQARMGSSRLPAKSLADLNGRPLIAHLIERATAATSVDQVVVATTLDESDDVLVDQCRVLGIETHRGSVDDLVARVAGAGRAFEADVVVRLWGDCPMIEPDVIDRAVCLLIERNGDYATNSTLAGRTYPIGLDIEVYRMELLERILQETDQSFLREFPMEFVREHADSMEVCFVRNDEDLSDVHLTIDYPEDLERFRRMLADLEIGSHRPDFRAAVAWLETNALHDVAHVRNADYTAKRQRYREEER